MKKYRLFILLILTCYGVHAQDCRPDASKRVQVTGDDTPNKYTCMIQMTRGYFKYYGTGFLIHPRVILTAGHNLAYYPLVKAPPFVLFRGTRKVSLYFGSISKGQTTTVVENLALETDRNKFYNSGYWFGSKIEKDYAIIILPDSSVYKKVGGYYHLSPEISNVHPEIHLTGSPGDQPLFQMWTEKTGNYQTSGATITYDLFTAVRNSGSPVWTEKSGEYDAVGVHSRGGSPCNMAVWITPQVYQQIKSWCVSAHIDL